MQERIKIILCNTTHPGNIGAAARAMKTMGLKQLSLVAPPQAFPSAEATARASGADDILTECQVCADLAEAVADTSLVAATTARVRSVRWPEHPPDAAARILLEKAQQQQDVAIVFGQESSGLSNAQLDLCNFMIRIPTHPDFSSLNLAAAVQIVCYELQRHLQALQPADEPLPEQAVSVQNMERFYQRLEQALIRLGYLDQNNPGKLMRRLRRLFNRAGLDNDEYQVLMGVLTAMEKRFGTDL